MTAFPSALLLLFGLVGAHVPKAFTLLYVILGITWVRARWLDSIGNELKTGKSHADFRVVRLLVLLFSLSYPLAMLHFGFWRPNGSQLLDIVSALLLPNGLFWWGSYMARRDFKMLTTCLLSYGIGALIFLVSALLMTRGFAWFDPVVDPGSLMMAWGNEASMNIRSIEQNGILNVVLLPIAISKLCRRHYGAALLLLVLAILGILAVLPLQNGRLWTVSLALAFLPLICSASHSLWKVMSAYHSGWRSRLKLPIVLSTLGLAILALIQHRANLCDERFAIYFQALRHWPGLISGGRTLSYDVIMCDGLTRSSLSLHAGSAPSFAMMHNVFLDVLATVGAIASLPMLLFLIFALFAFARFAFVLSCRRSWLYTNTALQLFWCFLAVIVPQWLFQPVIYGDGLLYYLSYAALGGLLIINMRGLPHSDFFVSE
jgi:hypothetical protein